MAPGSRGTRTRTQRPGRTVCMRVRRIRQDMATVQRVDGYKKLGGATHGGNIGSRNQSSPSHRAPASPAVKWGRASPHLSSGSEGGTAEAGPPRAGEPYFFSTTCARFLCGKGIGMNHEASVTCTCVLRTYRPG